jgi:hypothetical protein
MDPVSENGVTLQQPTQQPPLTLLGLDDIDTPAPIEPDQELIEESEKPVVKTAEQIEAEQKLHEVAKKKFTDEEISNFITMGKKLAAKPVLAMLISIIEEGEKSAEQKRLVELVRGCIPYDYCGFVQCEFAEIDWKLNICLSLVEKDYRADISIPDAKYVNDLYKQYNFLKGIAVAYWSQFIEEHNGLFRRICNYRADLNLAELRVDAKSPTSIYLDPGSRMRVGLLPYYVDAAGKPMRKR